MAGFQNGLDEVNYYFGEAAAQNAQINLTFFLDKCPYSSISAICVMLKNGHFVTRASVEAIENAPIIWGSEVGGYFSVRDDTLVHCHFRTRLARLYNAPPQAMFMIFQLPAALDHNQRRFSRRVGIDPESGNAFAIWHGVMDGGDFEKIPVLRWRKFEYTLCELDDLSANGLCIELPAKGRLAADLNINDPILLKADFGTAQRPAPLFVLGNIVRKMPKPDNKEIICVGCHFRSWRRVDAKNQQTWFRADTQEGIGLIAQWVSRNYRNVNVE